MKKVAILGIDLAKNVFQLHGVDAEGQPALKRRVRRERLLRVVADIEPYLIAVEACTGPFTGPEHFSNSETAFASSARSMPNPS